MESVHHFEPNPFTLNPFSHSHINPKRTTSQSPSPKPSSFETPQATISTILECEACGMDVTADSQARYRVTDENGKVHYVECFMCAMQLVNDYENFILKPTATGMDQTIQSLSTHRIMGQKSLLIHQQLFFSGAEVV